MKRFFILIGCILLIISLAIPAFAAATILDWHDYVASVTPGTDYDINDVFIPPSSTAKPRWAFYVNGSRLFYKYTPDFSYTYDGTEVDAVWALDADFSSICHFDITSIGLQDSLDLHFLFDGSAPSDFSYVIYTTFYDADDAYIYAGQGPIERPTVSSLGTVTIPVDLSSKPDNAASVTFKVVFTGEPLNTGDSFSVNYLGVSFEVLTPGTMPDNPKIIEPQDYLVNESSNGTTSTLYVSVPASDLAFSWRLLRNDDFSTIYQSVGNPFNVYFDRQEYDVWIDCHVYDKIDITDIVDGSTLTIDYDITPTLGSSQPQIGSIRYQVRYFDNAGNLLDNVNFFVVPDADWFDECKLDIVIDKPAGAVSMSFIPQFMDVTSDQLPCSFTLDLESVNFVCDIPTMVRVQQETGRTNKLLEQIKDGWEPDPSLPPFNDSLQDSLDKEDQIIDQLDPDGVVGDLDDIQVTVLDRILLLANSFQMISLMFQAFLKVPVLEVVAYVSLLLGLLASLLGIGMAAGRAVSRRESRSGKKGK